MQILSGLNVFVVLWFEEAGQTAKLITFEFSEYSIEYIIVITVDLLDRWTYIQTWWRTKCEYKHTEKGQNLKKIV